jgi:hypothetical protein
MPIEIAPSKAAGSFSTEAECLITCCFNDLNWLRSFLEFSGIDMATCHNFIASNGIPLGFLPGYIQSESLCGHLGDRLLGRFSKYIIFSSWGTTNAFVCSLPNNSQN